MQGSFLALGTKEIGMKKCIPTFIMVAILALGLALPAAAQKSNIAVVDVQKVIMTSKAGRSADTKIREEFGPIQEQISKMEEDLARLQEEAKKADESSFLSEDAKKKKREQFQVKFREYQQKGAKWEGELRQRQRALTETLIEKIRLIVADISKKRGYTLVLEQGDESLVVLWASEKIDITLEVINALDR
jgi:outer membrane protein